DCSLSALLSRLPKPLNDVLLPGCYIGGEDAQFWLRRGVRHLAGCDVYSLKTKWDSNVPLLEKAFGAKVDFRQGSIEDLPYDDESFDLVTTTAVLEHVRNLTAMSRETARVLRPNGICWHTFGPLYYSFGADHCISAFGFERGYDHLLLAEDEYKTLVDDQRFFDTLSDPNLPFWARNDQFSFATAQQYIEVFQRDFDVEHLVVKISDEGLMYRERHPDNWKKLLDAGVPEESLLIKSLAITLKKRQ
ncbi:MAG: class I SAM-dependent methyltransferase, partial [Planctomycetales bacterium]